MTNLKEHIEDQKIVDYQMKKESREPQKLTESITTAIMSTVSFNSEARNSQSTFQKNGQTNYLLGFLKNEFPFKRLKTISFTEIKRTILE